jgi:hypothetical protein
MTPNVRFPVPLAELSPEHPLRNAPLVEIGAEYRWCGGKVPTLWRPVRDAYLIAKSTYNELGPAWTQHDEWRATRDQSTSSKGDKA